MGGIVAGNKGGSIENCYNAGNISIEQEGTFSLSCGGVVGTNEGGTVINCYNKGTVSGNMNVGGVVGDGNSTKGGSIKYCYNIGTVTGNNSSSAFIGGVLGNCMGNGTENYLLGCYNTGEVSGNSGVGGVVGNNQGGDIANCYNTGKVTGFSGVGGVAGSNDSHTIVNCFNTGMVTGVNDPDKVKPFLIGGIAGTMNEEATVSNCYYLKGSVAIDGTLQNGIGADYGEEAAPDEEGATIPADEEQFLSGEVANSLNSNTTDESLYFYQKIGDSQPGFGGNPDESTVYCIYKTCNENEKPTYTNDAGQAQERPEHEEITGSDAKTATCTEQGYTGDIFCKNCGKKLADGTVTPITEHSYVSEVTKEATTTAAGIKTYTCSVCGDTKTEEIPKKENPSTGGPTGDDPSTGDNTQEGGNSSQESAGDSLPEGTISTLTDAGTRITSADTDKEDVKGSEFRTLRLKATGKNKSVKLTWKKVKNADGYIVYGSQCGKKMKKIKTIKKASTTSYTHKKLKKGKFYKYMVVAYKKVDGQSYVITGSCSVHVVTNGSRYGNPTKVSVKTSKLTIKKGRKKTIKPSYTLPKNKKLKTHMAKFRYESSNPQVAAVTKKGVVKAKKKGTCYIYVYAQNGVYKRVKVTVK